MAEPTGARGALYIQVQMLLAGHTIGEGMQALFDSLSAIICAASPDIRSAHTLTKGLERDLKADISEIFHNVKEQQAAAERKPN